MAAKTLDRQLTELEACRYSFGRNEATRVVKLLNRLDAARFSDTASLVRFHERYFSCAPFLKRQPRCAPLSAF